MLEEDIYWISASIMKNVGFKTIIKLYNEFGSLHKAWEANSNEIYRIFPPGSEQAKAFVSYRKKEDALKVSWADILKNEDIHLLKYIDGMYPKHLKELSSPPIIMYCKGNINLLNEKGCAVVGTRNPSQEGCERAKTLGRKIVENNETHISGLAVGIDTCGHRGALEGGGPSIGVLGSGLQQIFPKENDHLAREILRNNGLLISESPPHYRVSAFQLRNRNRIIAALSRLLVVVEATENSGSLIAARYARRLKKEIYVLGPINQYEKLHQGLIRIFERGNAIECRMEELILRMSAKDTLKPIIVPKYRKAEKTLSTLYTEDNFVMEILRAIANSPIFGKEKIKYLNKLKIHKICFKIIEALGFNVTRSWYLRGCYVHNENINRISLNNFINVPSFIPSVSGKVEKKLEELAKNENIFYTKTNIYLKRLYEKDAPEKYKNIYILNYKIQENLRNIDKLTKTGTSLSEWGVVIEEKNKNMQLIKEFISSCNVLDTIKFYADKIENILELLLTCNQEILKSKKIKSLEALYFDSIWTLIASNISVNTLKGPRKNEISLDLQNRVINKAEDILTETYRRIKDSLQNSQYAVR